MIALYHTTLGFPRVRLPVGSLSLIYGHHAVQASKNDRYGEIRLPERVVIDACNLIEIEVECQTVTKALLRLSYDSEFDLCIVLIPHTRFVKTVWLNAKSDKHRTLDARKYQVP